MASQPSPTRLPQPVVPFHAAARSCSVATIETYKTFFFPSKPRGKFAGKPITHPHILQWRYRFVPLYVAIWIGVIASYLLAFLESRDGLI